MESGSILLNADHLVMTLLMGQNHTCETNNGTEYCKVQIDAHSSVCNLTARTTVMRGCGRVLELVRWIALELATLDLRQSDTMPIWPYEFERKVAHHTPHTTHKPAADSSSRCGVRGDPSTLTTSGGDRTQLHSLLVGRCQFV